MLNKKIYLYYIYVQDIKQKKQLIDQFLAWIRFNQKYYDREWNIYSNIGKTYGSVRCFLMKDSTVSGKVAEKSRIWRSRGRWWITRSSIPLKSWTKLLLLLYPPHIRRNCKNWKLNSKHILTLKELVLSPFQLKCNGFYQFSDFN